MTRAVPSTPACGAWPPGVHAPPWRKISSGNRPAAGSTGGANGASGLPAPPPTPLPPQFSSGSWARPQFDSWELRPPDGSISRRRASGCGDRNEFELAAAGALAFPERGPDVATIGLQPAGLLVVRQRNPEQLRDHPFAQVAI